jgi:hypothetical protein
VSQQLVQLQDATIRQHCKTLRVPTIGAQFSTLAEQAVREKKTHLGYLEALLSAESEERERNTISRRIKEAHLPRVKTLEEFDYNQSPMISAAKMQELAAGGYLFLSMAYCGAALSQISHGTVGVIYLTDQKIIVAGDSRQGTGANATTDSACKILVLGADVVFMSSGATGFNADQETAHLGITTLRRAVPTAP